MFHRKGAALAAASALFACAGLVRAAEPRGALVPADAGLSLDRPVYLAETPPDSTIMGLANKLGVDKSLTDNNLKIGGYVEGSLSYNARDVRFNAGRVFDFENEDPSLNQVVLYIDKPIDWSNKNFQLGGRIEMMWGSDARLIHANGIFDHYGVADGPNEQFDPTQFYIDVYLPVGSGLRLRAGKFVTLFGAEVINPTGNLFFSHSYLFGFAIPFTHTGVYGTYNLSDSVQVDLGISRGWEQGFEDNNHDSIDVFGRVSYTLDAKSGTQLFITGIGGPEQAGDSGDYRYVLDVILNTKVSDQLSLSFNGDWGYEGHAGLDGSAAQWYGVAAYASYVLKKDLVNLNIRGEWFNDADGARGLGTRGSVYEATVGLDFTPFSSNRNFASLHIRPEIRYDYSSGPFFGNGDKHDQWTMAVDAVFGF